MMAKNPLRYFLFGALFLVIGWFFAGADNHFIANSEPATLIVLRLDTHALGAGKTAYRPVYALQTKVKPRPEYAGGPYISPMPHKVGDVVAGRYNAKTGAMRSDTLLARDNRMWWLAMLIGALCILQSIAVCFGLPAILQITSGRQRGWG